MTDPVASAPAKPPATAGASSPPDLTSRLAALEAAFASLVELQFTHDHDGLESARQWYEAYQAEHNPPVPSASDAQALPDAQAQSVVAEVAK